MLFDICRERALATLGEAAAKLQDAAPIGQAEFHFNLFDLSDLNAAEAIIDRVRSSCSTPACVIYCFELADASGYTLLRESFSHRAAICEHSGDKLSYSRLLNEQQPNALYVGSSRSFTSRFSQQWALARKGIVRWR